MVTAVSSPQADEGRLHDVFDCEPLTLIELAGRVERTCDDIQLVYREAEMDELWRAAAIVLTQLEYERASAEAIAAWAEIKNEVMRIHDLVGVDLSTDVAAAALRRLADTVAAVHAR